MRVIYYDMDDIVVRLNIVEHYTVSILDTDSNTPQNEEEDINVPPLNLANANSSPDYPVIILD